MHSSRVADQTSGGDGSPAASTPAARVTVNAIDVISGPAGAVTGHRAVTTGNLDVPGPFNNPSTGGVSNVHQIHFHVDSGSSAALTPRREIQRSAWFAGVENQNPPTRPLPPPMVGPPTPGGFNGVLVGPDGPAAHEVRRPSTSLLSVADAPGAAALSVAQCPFIYRSHFSVTVADAAGDVARAKYDVRIEKRTPTEVPNTENTITTVEKVDLVRGRSLS